MAYIEIKLMTELSDISQTDSLQVKKGVVLGKSLCGHCMNAQIVNLLDA